MIKLSRIGVAGREKAAFVFNDVATGVKQSFTIENSAESKTIQKFIIIIKIYNLKM